MEFKELFKTITINGLSIKNRIIMPAMALFYTDNYTFCERYKAFYRNRAKGGVGLMFIGPVAVDTIGSNPHMLGLFHNDQVLPLKEFVRELHHTTDVKVGIQLMHQGRNASGPGDGTTPIAPSAIPGILTRKVPREMTLDDVESVKESFVRSAVRAKEAGFDYIELIAGGGYLIAEFLSPLTNRRTDCYGGTADKRMRFGLELIQSLREALGNDMCIGIRVSGNDFVDGGNKQPESSLFSIEAVKAGVNAINVTGGWHETTVPQITSDVPPGAFLYLARAIREKVSVPVFASNRLGDPVWAEKALRAGVADMICWGRPLIADPELPRKVREGRLSEIVPCISCNQGCLDAIFLKSPVCCTVNPRVGREGEMKVRHSGQKKRIFVAGGGPAGMEFALDAILLGHDVVLYEASEMLGGQVNLIESIPGKESYAGVVRSLERRLVIHNATIKRGTRLTSEMVDLEKPDLVVIATGAQPVELKIPGIDMAHVVRAWDILDGSVSEIGRHVIVIGGGATGCETALMIASLDIPSAETFAFLAFQAAEDLEILRRMLYTSGRKVTVIEMAPRLASTMGVSTRWPLIKRLNLLSVDVRTKTRILRIEKDSVLIESDSGQEQLPADTIVIAAGSTPLNTLAQELQAASIDTITIGDAKQPRRILDAVRDGFDAALTI
ncbi:MAG: FAD-dependent oxidoreductase [Pseudomonadota bacterium]